MVDIVFRLRLDLPPAQREAVLRRINALPEVVSATPVKPDATQPFTRSFHLARVEANANPAALLAALSAMPEVTDAEIPPRRGLSVPPGSAPDDA